MPSALGAIALTNVAAVVDISSIPVGAWMVATLYQSGSYQTAPPPAGWRNLLANNSQQSGTRAQAYAGRIKQAGDTTISWGPEFAAQSGARRLVVFYGTEAVAPVTDWRVGLIGVRASANVVSGQSVLAGSTSTSVAPGVAVTIDDSLILSILSETTNTAGTFAITSGGATQFYSSGDTDTVEFVVAGSRIADVGTTADVIATAQQTQASNGQGVQIVLPPPSVTPPTPVVATAFASVSEMLTRDGVTWAHRGNSTVMAEESMAAYDFAYAQGYRVFEVSMGLTSDDVWVLIHDNSLNRTSQTTGLPAIRSMTWAEVQTYQNTLQSQGGPQPYLRWEQLRDKYADKVLFVLDPKNYNWGAYQEAFLDLCDELGPDRVIVKQYASDMSLCWAARGRGYQAWGHTFEDFIASPSLSEYLDAWTLLGIGYARPQAEWDTLLATGKPVFGHVAPTQAAYDTSMAKGAFGVQCGGTDVITAVAALPRAEQPFSKVYVGDQEVQAVYVGDRVIWP